MELLIKKLNILYCFIQSFYFIVLCACLGFASIYLLQMGFSNTLIGTVLALSSIVSVILQPIVASFIDKNKYLTIHNIINFFLIIVLILSFILIALNLNILMIAILYVIILSIFMTLQPLVNLLTFIFRTQNIDLNFGLARGIGSGAYALSSIILGVFLEMFHASWLPLFFIIFSLFMLFCISSFKSPYSKEQLHLEKPKQLSLYLFIKKYKKFSLLLLGIICVYYGHASITYFYIQVMESIGGSSSTMGMAVFLASILEIPTMFLFIKIKKRINCSNLMVISAISFTLKHGLIFISPNVIMVYIAQIFQMAGFALLIPTSVYYVNEYIDDSDNIKGQALITVAMTLAGVFASLIGGTMIDLLGVSMHLFIGFIITIIGLIITFISVERKKNLDI